jgi:hypothetical protein
MVWESGLRERSGTSISLRSSRGRNRSVMILTKSGAGSRFYQPPE